MTTAIAHDYGNGGTHRLPVVDRRRVSLVGRVAALAAVVAAASLGFTQSADAAGVAAAPTNLHATVRGTTVLLTWTNAPGSVGVNLYRDASLKTQMRRIDPAPTSYLDTNVDTGSHTYAVANDGRHGGWLMSSPVTVTIGTTPAPTVTSLSVTTGPAAGGTAVTVTGMNFTGATAVKFGKRAASFSVTNDTTIATTSPVGSGTVYVTVTTPGGTSATNAGAQFKYIGTPPPAPRVTGVSPSSGSSGTKVTVSGTDLTGATAVTFGPGHPGTSLTVVNATTLTVDAPAGSGTVDVQVTTPSGTSMVQTLDWFTYTASLTLNPTQVIVPADGSIEGGITATLTKGGNAATGVTVTATETTPSMGSKPLSSCTTDSTGECVILTLADSTQETGTVAVLASGFAKGTAKVLYKAPGTAPTGLAVSVTNGDGSAAKVSGADTYSDGNHYFLEESTGRAAEYENTPAEAVVGVTMVNGTTPLSSGVEPYAVNWTLKNTGANTLYIAAIANIAETPYTNVICTLATQMDTHGSLKCTPSSYDLDYNPHFSNPANPGKFGLGINNGTMSPETGGARTVNAGQTISFTTYMVGQNNNARVVLDSATTLPVSATIGAQLAHDPAFSTIGGAVFGNTVQSNLRWVAPASGSSVSGSLVASNPTETGEPDSVHDWMVLNVSTTATLVNFGQTASQAYSVNGGSVTEDVFESDLAGAPTSSPVSVTNYGAVGQANSLTG